jgi:hypothetical protein
MIPNSNKKKNGPESSHSNLLSQHIIEKARKIYSIKSTKPTGTVWHTSRWRGLL